MHFSFLLINKCFTSDPNEFHRPNLGLHLQISLNLLLHINIVIEALHEHCICCRRVQTETETKRTPRLLGSKFIKQASSDSADLSPKAEPREQRRALLYTI
jgi:hypothetical protein